MRTEWRERCWSDERERERDEGPPRPPRRHCVYRARIGRADTHRGARDCMCDAETAACVRRCSATHRAPRTARRTERECPGSARVPRARAAVRGAPRYRTRYRTRCRRDCAASIARTTIRGESTVVRDCRTAGDHDHDDNNNAGDYDFARFTPRRNRRKMEMREPAGKKGSLKRTGHRVRAIVRVHVCAATEETCPTSLVSRQ